VAPPVRLLLFTALATLIATGTASAQEAPEAPPEDAEPTLSPPELIQFVQADYPEAAADEGRGGDVVLRLTISAEGVVEVAEVVESAGADLDEAARAAALAFRFEPARRDGEAIAARIRYTYEFTPPDPALPSTGALHGTVMDEVSDQGVVGARVVFVGEADGAELADTRTNAEGAFMSGSLPVGIVTVRVEAPGFEAASLTTEVLPGSSAEVRLVLSETVDAPAIEVVVTGARVAEAADQAVVATEVVTREEIEESGARDAAEVLEERSGLQITRSFRGTELWLRGMDPEYTLILVDGDRVPGRIGGAVDLSRYGVENIERIEIVRGPSSALYGSDAIGGVVNILTRESDEPFEADAMASFGMGGIVDATARVAGRPSEHFALQLSGGVHHADAYRLDDSTEVTSGSGRLQWSVGGRGDWMPTRRDRVRAIADYIRTDLNGVDPGAGAALFDRSQIQEQLQTGLEYRITGKKVQLSNRLSYSLFRDQFLSDQRGSDQLDDYQDNREHLGQLTSILRVPLNEDNATTIGMEHLFQRLISERLTDSGRRYRLAVFAQHEWRIFEQGALALKVVPGVRLDVDSQFGDQVSPKLSVRFDASEDVLFRASYGRGFRAPSFQELLLRFENPGVGYVVDGNPDLGPESSHGFDVAAEWTPLEWLEIAAAFFRNDVQEMIALVTDSTAMGTEFTYDNITDAWTMGVESSAKLSWDDYLSLTLGYTFLSTWDGENERQLEGRPAHRPTFSGRVMYPAWDIGLVFRGAFLFDRVYYQDLDGDGDAEELYQDPISQIDLRLFKRFTRHLELFVGVDNLLDSGDEFSVLRPLTVYGGARGQY